MTGKKVPSAADVLPPGGWPRRVSRRPPRASRANLLLRFLIGGVTAVPLLGLVTNESTIPTGTRFLAALLWGLCLVPAWEYTIEVRKRPPIPFMPMIGLLFGLYYAAPVFAVDHDIYARFAIESAYDYDAPILLALLGWSVLLAAYKGGAARQRATVQRRITADRMPVALLFVVAAVGLALDVLPVFVQVPTTLGAIRHIFVLVGRLAMTMLVLQSLRDRLGMFGKGMLLVVILSGIAVQATSGLVANLAFYLALIFLAIWVERGEFKPSMLVAVVAGVAMIVALKGVTDEFRREVWFGGQSQNTFQRLDLIGDLLAARFAEAGLHGVVTGGASTVASRSLTLDLFADVVRRTPDEIPYWGGASMVSLAGMLVPRILWPTKPEKRIGQDFGHRYSYLASSDLRTSLNLPWLVEFYANFGAIGVVLGMSMVGSLYATLMRHFNAIGQAPEWSLLGMTVLVPLFNIESDFSLTFGGLFLNTVTILAIVRFLRLQKHA